MKSVAPIVAARSRSAPSSSPEMTTIGNSRMRCTFELRTRLSSSKPSTLGIVRSVMTTRIEESSRIACQAASPSMTSRMSNRSRMCWTIDARTMRESSAMSTRGLGGADGVDVLAVSVGKPTSWGERRVRPTPDVRKFRGRNLDGI